jgi:monodechloroaminopyrrolnitrin synthase
VTRLYEAFNQHRDDERALGHLRASVEAVSRVMRGLVAFRCKHLALAREAYNDSASRYAHGSGGGTTDLLALITNLSRDNAMLVNRLLGKTGGRRGRS